MTIEQKSLEERFEQLIQDWEVYCSQPNVLASSMGGVVRDCKPYKEIVAMGKDVLPLIRRRVYTRCSGDTGFWVMRGHGLVYAVKEIVGDDFQIPLEIRGKIEEIEKYTKDWLDKNMDKYCKREN